MENLYLISIFFILKIKTHCNFERKMMKIFYINKNLIDNFLMVIIALKISINKSG